MPALSPDSQFRISGLNFKPGHLLQGSVLYLRLEENVTLQVFYFTEKNTSLPSMYSIISCSTELEQSNQCLKTDEFVIKVPTLDFARKDIKS